MEERLKESVDQIIQAIYKTGKTLEEKKRMFSNVFNTMGLSVDKLFEMLRNEIPKGQFWNSFYTFVIEWITLQEIMIQAKLIDGRNEYGASLAAELAKNVNLRTLQMYLMFGKYAPHDDRSPEETAAALARCLCDEHRTIQQSITQFCLYAIHELACDNEISPMFTVKPPTSVLGNEWRDELYTVIQEMDYFVLHDSAGSNRTIDLDKEKWWKTPYI